MHLADPSDSWLLKDICQHDRQRLVLVLCWSLIGKREGKSDGARLRVYSISTTTD